MWVPGLASVCTALKAVVGVAQTVHKLASDALEMTESVLEIGRYLIDLQQLAKRMKEQIDTELDHHMGRLAELVGEMKMAIEAFGQRGFLKKMFSTTHMVRKLMSIERRKKAILEAIDRII